MKHIITAAVLGLVPAASLAETVKVEVWADNWFSMYVNGELVLEDSVPITTERSFNAEVATIEIDLPAQVAFIAKDFKENDTGLEYIGTRRQQMGDGGLIAQLTSSSGTIAVTDANAKCLVVHRAPVERSCADEGSPAEGQGACASIASYEPEGWADASFDDSAWPAAVEHSEADVSPKFGYDEVSWDTDAAIIWSADLLQDNTILCRLPVLQ